MNCNTNQPTSEERERELSVYGSVAAMTAFAFGDDFARSDFIKSNLSGRVETLLELSKDHSSCTAAGRKNAVDFDSLASLEKDASPMDGESMMLFEKGVGGIPVLPTEIVRVAKPANASLTEDDFPWEGGDEFDGSEVDSIWEAFNRGEMEVEVGVALP
jgi:hypothetical protein